MLDRIFSLMSPDTLASLAADVQALGTGADRFALDVERRAMAALTEALGDRERADALVGLAMDRIMEEADRG